LASDCDWFSPKQKGFLSGVHGIQKHMLLESVIEEAKIKKGHLATCWLDLVNAFGSLPHYFLHQLFESLPIPTELLYILSDIHTDSIFQLFFFISFIHFILHFFIIFPLKI
jgi:hypothetical protein